jgi:hypothetical protein
MAVTFISYNRRSLDAVKTPAQDLTDAGHEVWFDQVLSGGQEWWDEILAHIRRCDAFVAILTPECLESPACRQELSYAAALGKTVVPVRLSDKIDSDRLPEHLRTLHFVDCYALDKRSVLNLVKAISRVPLNRRPPTPVPAAPPVPELAVVKTDRTLEVSELTHQLQATLIRVLDFQETWLLGADPKNQIRIDFPPGSAATVRARAVFRDNSDKTKLRELQDLGWSTNSRGLRKAAGGIALGVATFNTAGIAGALVLSGRVRDYFMTSEATKSWPVATARAELPSIAGQISQGLQAISPRARSAVLSSESEPSALATIRRRIPL